MTDEPSFNSTWVGFRKLFAFGRSRVFLNSTRIDSHHGPEVAAWKTLAARMRPDDHILWMTFWHADDAYYRAAAEFYRDLPVPARNVWVLGNTEAETRAAQAAGFRAAWVNHNAWLDERILRPMEAVKKFRAILVSQLAPYKRIHLAAQVEGLAVAPGALFPLHKGRECAIPPRATLIESLPPGGIAELLACCRVGLMLSEEEGASYASSEYLLCGLPVVSTPSRGGRDVFYNDDNSKIVEPTADAVAAGVTELIARAPDRWALHRAHVAQSLAFRSRFIGDVLAPILRDAGSSMDPAAAFVAIYKHKMIDFVPGAEAMNIIQTL